MTDTKLEKKAKTPSKIKMYMPSNTQAQMPTVYGLAAVRVAGGFLEVVVPADRLKAEKERLVRPMLSAAEYKKVKK